MGNPGNIEGQGKRLLELLDIFNPFLATEKVPSGWRTENKVLLFKKDGTDKPGNCRSVSLH